MPEITTGSPELWDILQRMAREYISGRLAISTSRIQGSLALELAPIYVSNDSGETIPAYACMQVTGAIEIGSQNFLIADKPADTDGTAGWYLFNSHQAIASGEQGVAQYGTVVRAFKNTGTVTAGDEWRPTVNQWYLTSGGGSFIAAGGDDVAANVFRVFSSSGGGGGGDFVEEVRWVDPVLEYRIGSTWYLIDTAEDCVAAVIDGGTP